MRVRVLVATLILSVAQLLVAQAPGSNKSRILFQTDGPPAVTNITTQVSGSGTQTFYYWVEPIIQSVVALLVGHR